MPSPSVSLATATGLPFPPLKRKAISVPVDPVFGHTEETPRSIRRVGRSHDVSVAGIGHVRGLDRAGASIRQTTEGARSPAVGETHAHVTTTIVCPGVDPQALQRLNELLDKKDLELQDRIREAEA
jgi:hypothetical protein